jgi:hypothetical protein
MINHPNRSRVRKAPIVTAAVAATGHNHDQNYARLLTSIQDRFNASVADGAPLFRTDAADLWNIYLDALPSERQYHTCHACRRFIETYGSLVAIAGDGTQSPAIWPSETDATFYLPAVEAMHAIVRRARVTGVFLTKDTTLGLPVTGQWTHLAVRGAKPFRHSVLTPGQAAASKREDFGTVARALQDFTPDALAEALRVLEADAVNRAERFLGPIQWLADLHVARSATKDSRVRDNILWRAIATAPDGYCHPRSSVVGTLLEDILAGLPFADVQRRFNAKMHPLMYQRPQAAPAAGAIAAAEKIVERMGIAPSLERRFARLEDLEIAWHPIEVTEKTAANGVFGHIKPKGGPTASRPLELPATTLTWEKFARTVLPTAEAMDLNVPPHGNFTAHLTAVHADAPPILKWDREDHRNPVSVYVYHGGSPASQWGISPGWHKVTAFVLLPNLWGDQPSPHLGDGGTLILDGAVDGRDNSGIALFPEILRQELHEVRSVIEAYSRTGRIQGREQASACGLRIPKGAIGITVRTLSAGRWTSHIIDRWD